jgi:molecular chaperone DnaK (HSP70)
MTQVFKLIAYVYDIGQRTTPSVVAFADNEQRLVGVPAKRQVSVLTLQHELTILSSNVATMILEYLSIFKLYYRL